MCYCDAERVEHTLAAARVPVSKVRRIAEVIAHEHVRERDVFVDASVAGLDRHLQLTGSGFRFADDVPLRSACVPRVGEHTEEILAEVGLR